MNHFILYAAWSAGVLSLSLGPLATACLPALLLGILSKQTVRF
jgi:hypothetical protein